MNTDPTGTTWLTASGPAQKKGSDLLSFVAAGVSIEAAAAAEEGKPPKARKFAMTAYNGGAMQVSAYGLPVVVDLAGLDVGNSPRPILIDHERDIDSVLGQTDKVEVKGNSLLVAGSVFGDSDQAKRVIGLNDRGFKFQASIGARVLNREFVPEGSKATVNGREFSGPINVARKSVLGEVSFVVLGADDTTSASIAANAAKGIVMDFEQWLEAKGIAADGLSDALRSTLKAAFDAEQAAAKDKHKGGGGGGTSAGDTLVAGDGDDTLAGEAGNDLVLASRKALSAEKRRVAAMATLTAKYAREVPADKMATIEASAIDEGWDANKLELELIRASRPPARGGAGGGNGGGGFLARIRSSAAVIAAAMSISAGISAEAVAKTINAADREQVMNDATSATMRGFSLHALMDTVIHAAGHHFYGSRKSDDFIRAALAAERELLRASSIQADGFGTMSLSNILSNVANKGLIAAYSAVEVCWPNVCGVRSHSDFKVHTRYRLDSTGAFKKVAADGELKQVGLTDASYTNQLGTYGAIIALTRQMQYNDDLGAFMEIPNLLGRMAALRLEEAVMVLLLSNPSSFFHANNKNLATGAGSALSIAALTVAEQKFSDFVDANGKPILVSPDRILVGSALRTTANQLNTQTTVITTGMPTTARNVEPNNNPHVGKYKPYYSPYLNNASIKDQDGAAITGQSSTLWYMLADPAVRAALAVAFLNGQRVPTIESSSTEFDTLGIQWRAFHDFGVGMEETTAAVRSDGA